MKTAIQQSIEKIKYFQDSTDNFAEKRAFAIAMDVLEDHKKTEKEQSHYYAKFAIQCDRKDIKILNFEDFINL